MTFLWRPQHVLIISRSSQGGLLLVCVCVCVFDLCIYVAYCGHYVVVLVDIYAFWVALVAKRRIAEI